MDFAQGGDFFALLRRFGRLREHAARVYVAEVALALDHLHTHGVIYRDLKPENVLLDADGHAVLADFGLSRWFEDRPPLAGDDTAPAPPARGGGVGGVGGGGPITRSYCGTEQYMAPEMLLQRGHGRAVDWWCLGLLAHEMLSGRHPFSGPTHYDTLRAMVASEPRVEPRLSSGAHSLVRRLLVKDAARRLGARRGARELALQSFFAGLDWEQLLTRRIAAPFVPSVDSGTDTAYFEAVFTRERPVDSEAPTPPPRAGARRPCDESDIRAC